VTDFDEIWHGDASGIPTANQPLKFPKFENLKWQTAATLLKNRFISLTV